ncbi:MAG: sigma-70 family RNA polymerase sigma factor [Candidatus Omnitrophota bacterium]|nr:sigma-70 family RNA polymerase sigma factor [Candidatus Omnitrophota bacterium]
MEEDNALIKQFVEGDVKGFEMLVKKYQNRVLNIVYSLLGQDRESEDILQEVFIKVYNSLRAFNAKAQFSTWLYRISVNTTYDFLRKRKHFVSEEKMQDISTKPQEGTAEILHTKEREELLHKSLEALPFKYRTAVVLKDIEGLGYLQIAKILGCSIGTVESRLYRVRQLLKERLIPLIS